MNEMTNGQWAALSDLLSQFPDNLPFDEIIRRIRAGELEEWEGGENNEDNDIIVWEGAEHYDNNDLADEIIKQAGKIDELNLITYGEIK